MSKFQPTRVILHCSATPDYPDSSAKYDLFGADDINEWHMKRGFNGIGYHYVIRRTGDIEKGRPITEMGAHCKGENYNTIGICLIGTRWPTEEQVKSLMSLYRKIRNTFQIQPEDWHGHNEFTNKKTCPGFPVSLLRETLKYAEKCRNPQNNEVT